MQLKNVVQVYCMVNHRSYILHKFLGNDFGLNIKNLINIFLNTGKICTSSICMEYFFRRYTSSVCV
jgi:hypothetical protein